MKSRRKLFFSAVSSGRKNKITDNNFDVEKLLHIEGKNISQDRFFAQSLNPLGGCYN